ncbi:putative deoxyribonuclease tatdn3 isoform X1 [Brienomyrus brachyistius]|uniref:putative deoxyribonuclease tatdn3 isoform X1 n=1 Tax=Brienomyrus brachyistius TaxID=42636 RepID=UPI0020B3F5C3|nr:putative deoxyribonuclease tatdn3 isoform X1 [Brienomyrus brachyistius]
MDGGFIDCHCHISAAEFTKDRDDVIKRAEEAGVRMLISVTEEASEFEKAVQLSKSYPGLLVPCLGIHPVQHSDSREHRSVAIQDLECALPLFQKYKDDIVAIGEIGLDFTPWYAPYPQQRAEQQQVFRRQLEIAKEMDLPVNIHSRSAARQTIRILKEQGIGHALLHNFAGRPSVAMEGVKAGYCFSFPPAACRNEQRAAVIKQIPLEHICLETDSPALGPEKHVRNEPKNIVLSCEYIAKVKGLTPEKVMEATTWNAVRLFPRIGKILNQMTEPLSGNRPAE